MPALSQAFAAESMTVASMAVCADPTESLSTISTLQLCYECSSLCTLKMSRNSTEITAAPFKMLRNISAREKNIYISDHIYDLKDLVNLCTDISKQQFIQLKRNI